MAPSSFPNSTQILIKNTFIQFEDSATVKLNQNGPRPRGDSCDAVLFSATPSTRCKTLDALICIPENPSTTRGADEDTTDQDSAAGSASTNAIGPLREKSDTTSSYVDSRLPCDSINSHKHSPLMDEGALDSRVAIGGVTRGLDVEQPHSISPAELLESLVACEQLKRMPLEDLPAPPHDKTTIMLRNIPNKYTQTMLLDTVDQEFRGLYDFFYLPIDFKNKCNVGYAFINFIHPYYAELFSKKFAGLKLTAFKSKKICEVSWGRVQGLRANIEHYRNSAIMSIPNSQYKPLIFKDGISLQFPGPAGPVPSVKPRHGRTSQAS